MRPSASTLGSRLPAALALASVAVVGCGQGPMFADLSGGENRLVFVALVDDDALVGVHGPVQIEGGARTSGGPLELELEGERPYLVEIPTEAAAHPLGPVDPQSVALVENPEVLAWPEGTQLRLRERLPTPTRVSRLTDSGPVEASVDELDLRWERSVETEPCSPPLTVMTEAFPGRAHPLDGYGEDGSDERVLFMVPFDEGRVALIGEKRVVVVTDGMFPPTDANPAWLVDTGGLRVNAMLDTGEQYGVLLAGRLEGTGGIFRLEVDASGVGLESVAQAADGRDIEGLGQTSDGTFWTVDEDGNVARAPEPSGPWADVTPDSFILGSPTYLETSGERVAVSHAGALVIWSGGEWLDVDLSDLPATEDIRAMTWTSDGALWFGASEGTLGVWTGSSPEIVRPRYPVRLHPCADIEGSYAEVEIHALVSDLVEVDGSLVVVQDRCSALYGFRLQDRCPFVLEPLLGSPEVVRNHNRRLFESEGAWYLSQKWGQLVKGFRR